jgi:predicted amidohydrolase
MRRMIAGLWSRKNYDKAGSSKDARIKALKDCVQKLALQVKQEKIEDSEIQGILVAPEYFFTKPDPGTWDGAQFLTRAISQAEKEQAVAEFESVSKAFPTLLLVPGTIAWKKPLVRSASETRKKDKVTGQRTGPLKTTSRLDKALASLQYEQTTTGEKMGGARKAAPDLLAALEQWVDYYYVYTTDDELYKLVMAVLHDDKELQDVFNWSGLDKSHYTEIPALADKMALLKTGSFIMRNTAYALLKGRVRFKYNKQGDFHEAIGDTGTVFIPGAKTGIATIAGIRFGFEICLDHNIGYLKPPVADPKEGRDIHIVTSAAVENNDNHMFMHPGGYFLHASTNHGWTAVYHNHYQTGIAKITPPYAADTVDGDPLEYWKIELP